MTKEQFDEVYGETQLKFSGYCKSTFFFSGKTTGGKTIIASFNNGRDLNFTRDTIFNASLAEENWHSLYLVDNGVTNFIYLRDA